MFATRVRVRPWSCLCPFASDGRVTTSVPSTVSIVIAGGSERVRVPLGPVTVMTGPSKLTSTPAGIRIGCRPMRDMASPYQTYARTSPPSCALRACWPVMIPWLVLTMTIPRPPRTRGISVFRA